MPELGFLMSRALRAIDRLAPPATAEAHCDIPCGIYDPHLAQVGALTVVRMNQMIDALELPKGADKASETAYHNSLTRYIHVKEEHAELVKREIRIIWGDYFKPEHLDKHSDIHKLSWNIEKLAGKNKHEVNMDSAQELLASVQRFAEIFWDTKGVPTKRQSSHQTAGGEFVVPA